MISTHKNYLSDEDFEILRLCKEKEAFPYENADKISRLMSKRAGCSLNTCVVIDKLIRIIEALA